MDKFKFLILVIIIFFMIQCNYENVNNNPCDGVAPPSEWEAFVVLNNEGKSLVGKDRIYHPDSVNLFSLTQDVHLGLLFDSVFVFNYSGWISSDDYFLRLSSTDIDTINIQLDTIKDECFTYKRINTFSVNNIILNNNGGLYLYYK